MLEALQELQRRGFAGRVESAGRRLEGGRHWLGLVASVTATEPDLWRRWLREKRRCPPPWAWRMVAACEWVAGRWGEGWRERVYTFSDRWRTDLSQAGAAHALGVSRRTVIRWERGQEVPEWAWRLYWLYECGWRPPVESPRVRNGAARRTPGNVPGGTLR